jgi:ABC-type transport system involved in multi-copper enzyme maturation permease subunit
MALFFATMLVGEDVEMNTLTYVLTRPMPRSAWVLGRYIAYLLVTTVILMTSVFLTFTASTSLSKLAFVPTDLALLAHYCGVVFMSLLASGTVAMFLGAYTKRPIVYGVLLLYAWQRLANMIPGMIDFLTIDKYIDAILPLLPTMRREEITQQFFGATINKAPYMIGSTQAMITLLFITGLFLWLTVWAVRNREYAGSRAAGS